MKGAAACTRAPLNTEAPLAIWGSVEIGNRLNSASSINRVMVDIRALHRAIASIALTMA